MQTILITGCGGMLGKAAYNILSDRYNLIATDIDINEDWLIYLDVININDFERILKVGSSYPKVDAIWHFAALTDLEYCEINSDYSYMVNALGAENAMLMAKKYNIPLVYISTAGIFDNPLQEYYNDFDIPNPQSIYGKSKYYGEKIALTYEKSYVFRAGWMMGGCEKDKKFVNKIFKQIKSGAKELYVVDDKLGTPTYTNDFIHNILNVTQHGYYGLYNQVCNGSASRYDVACEMVQLMGLDIEVIKVGSEYFKDEYFAPRPYSEKLLNMKLTVYDLNGMRDWRTCLKEYINENYFRLD